MWRPNTLRENMDQLDQFQTASNGRVRCPNCRALRIPDCVVDVRHLPIAEDWACDCCWTHWERTGRIVDGGGAINGRFDWRRRWVIAHNAPQDVVDKFARLNREPATN